MRELESLRDDGRKRVADALGPAHAEMLPGHAQDLVLHVGVLRGQQVQQAAHQA